MHDDVFCFGVAYLRKEVSDLFLLPQVNWLHDDLSQCEEMRGAAHQFDYLINLAERRALFAFWIDVVYASII